LRKRPTTAAGAARQHAIRSRTFGDRASSGDAARSKDTLNSAKRQIEPAAEHGELLANGRVSRLSSECLGAFAPIACELG